MLRISLAQVRAGAGRLVATSLAIVIATGFVVATLVIDATSRATILRAIGAQYTTVTAAVSLDDADVSFGSDAAGDALLTKVAALPQAGAAALDRSADVQVRLPGTSGRSDASVLSVAADPALRWQHLLSGRLPVRAGEVAVASQAGVAPGAQLTVLHQPAAAGQDGTAQQRPVASVARVVGVVDQRGDPRASAVLRVFATDAQTIAWGATGSSVVRVVARAGVPAGQLIGALRADAGTLGPHEPVQVASGEQAAEKAAASYTGDAAALTAVLLAFAVVAAFVSALVIANTFAVLLAQRTRELALLRCVGATGRQVRRGVLLESAVIGTLAAAVGVGTGIGVAAGLIQLAPRSSTSIPISGLSVPLLAVLAGLGTGIGITVLAALVPAFRATRVKPLAALRPVDDAPVRSRTGLARLTAGLVLFSAGLAVLGAGAVQGVLPVGVLGGFLSFIGVILLARRAVPAAAGLAGRVLGRFGGVTGELAASNAVRNPARTAATALALLIGVTLTTTMVVGAASTRASAGAILDDRFAADVVVHGSGLDPLPGRLTSGIAALPGVAGVVPIRTARITGPDRQAADVEGVAPAAAAAVFRSPGAIPSRGVVLVPPHYPGWGPGGGHVTLTGGPRRLTLTVRVSAAAEQPRLSSPDLLALAPRATTGSIAVRLTDPVAKSPAGVVGRITNLAGDTDPGSSVSGPALDRAAFDKILDIMLLVVTALLAVAVLIAVIGVGNTIALSVIERRQETGLLRALGLTRRQLRSMLLCEAALVAGVASVLGVALGTLYGITGTSSVLARAVADGSSISVAVPWLQVTAIVLVATAAGALASVLPSRRAARTSPVAAIAS